MEQSNKHEAILKAKQLITGTTENPTKSNPKQTTTMTQSTEFTTYQKALKVAPDFGWVKYVLLPSVEKKMSTNAGS